MNLFNRRKEEVRSYNHPTFGFSPRSKTKTFVIFAAAKLLVHAFV